MKQYRRRLHHRDRSQGGTKNALQPWQNQNDSVGDTACIVPKRHGKHTVRREMTKVELSRKHSDRIIGRR
ncbi:hypothetical protein DER44DRAFT_796704 [Fusarium oxysporum]|nr:hypothetical protein DER44DRAFT_796704 [Fusarium oxysporum]